MDAICLSLMKKFCLAGKGCYVIYGEDELYECAPDGEAVSREDVLAALQTLAADRYIDIKYSRGDLYCIAALKACPEGDCIAPAIAGAAASVSDRLLYVLCAAFSFLGGFLGSFIVCIVFAAVT